MTGTQTFVATTVECPSEAIQCCESTPKSTAFHSSLFCFTAPYRPLIAHQSHILKKKKNQKRTDSHFHRAICMLVTKVKHRVKNMTDIFLLKLSENINTNKKKGKWILDLHSSGGKTETRKTSPKRLKWIYQGRPLVVWGSLKVVNNAVFRTVLLLRGNSSFLRYDMIDCKAMSYTPGKQSRLCELR